MEESRGLARILVLDGHAAAALAFTRSLGRAGHWVAVGANQGMFAPAKLSKYCREHFEYPVSTADTRVFTGEVVEYATRNKVELIIPITDWTVLPLSQLRNQVTEAAKVALPSPSAVELASDKYRTVELARSLGIPVPATWLITSPSDLEGLPPMAFPVVVKDRFSVRWAGAHAVFGSVAYAYTRAELSQKVTDRLREAGDVLVQEFVRGTGIGFSCFSLGGKMHIPFQWERVRETDPRGSGSSARRSIAVSPEVRDFSAELIRRAGFEGIAMVDFKREPVSRRPVLMELDSAGHCEWCGLSTVCGGMVAGACRAAPRPVFQDGHHLPPYGRRIDTSRKPETGNASRLACALSALLEQPDEDRRPLVSGFTLRRFRFFRSAAGSGRDRKLVPHPAEEARREELTAVRRVVAQGRMSGGLGRGADQLIAQGTHGISPRGLNCGNRTL